MTPLTSENRLPYNGYVRLKKHKEGIASAIVLIALALAGTGGVVVASDQAAPGDTLYSIDQVAERVRLALATSSEARAEIEASRAQERIEEAMRLVEQNRERNIEEALERYREHVENANQRIDEARQQGRDVDAILERLAENYTRHQEVLSDVYDRVPENARGAVQRAIENTSDGYNRAIDAVSRDRQEEVMDKTRERMENTVRDLEQRGVDVMLHTPTTQRSQDRTRDASPDASGNSR